MDELTSIVIPGIMKRVKMNLPVCYKLDLNEGSIAYDLIATTVISVLQEDTFIDFVGDRFAERLKRSVGFGRE